MAILVREERVKRRYEVFKVTVRFFVGHNVHEREFEVRSCDSK